MSKKQLVFLLLCLWLNSWAQGVKKYEYWFDQQAESRQAGTTQSGQVQLSLDVSQLAVGLHTLSFRAQDEGGSWSSPSTSYFIRTKGHQTNNRISKYQYWIDSQTAQAVTAATDGTVSLNIDVASLPKGLHSLTFRAQDEWGQWSAPSTSYFLRVDPKTQNVLTRYEYWFDGNIAERQSASTTDGLVELDLDVSALSYGVHTLAFRMADSRGRWSSPSTSYFVKSRLTASPNLIAGYQYWFNEAGSQTTYVELSEPASPAVIDVQLPVNNLKTKVTPQNIAVTSDENGKQVIVLKNALHTRFKDLNGHWSTLQTDSFTVAMDNEELDMTAFIANPDASEYYNGWTSDNGYWEVREDDHFSGQDEPYFHLYGSTTMKQRISGLPAGSYTLVLMARATSGGEGEIRANGYTADISSSDWSQHVLPFVTNGSPFDLEITNKNSSGYVDADDLMLMTTIERQAIAMTVTDSQGNDVTQQVTIRWYDAEGKLMGTGNTISGVKKGGDMYYSIELGEDLGRTFREVNLRSFKADSNRITCQLERIGELMLTAHVIDAEHKFDLQGANIGVTQWLNGKYAQHFTTQTDRQGMFSLQVAADSTIVTISSDGYVEQHINIVQGADGEMGTIAMSEATGLMIIPDLAYQPSVKTGTEPEVQDWYADQANVSYTVYNLTTQNDLQASVQRGIIIVPNGYEDGQRLCVTATSRNGQFATTSREVQVVQQNETIHVPLLLVEHGAIEVTYGGKGDEESLAMVYNSQGRMVHRTTFSTNKTTFEGLAADTYQLLTMGYDGTMGTVANLNDILSLGLQDGIDYVCNTVTVNDGHISSLNVDSVPEMDRSKFSYTSVNTSYLPNKNQFVTGNFVTLTGRVDFKTQYHGNVSDILVSFDIPDGCVFVDNSVVIGTRQVPYALSGDKLTVALDPDDIDSRIRFCMTPTRSGIFTTSAYASFNCNGEKTQSIGSAYFEATDMAIGAPSSTRKTQIPVSGVATPQAQIEVYDNGNLIGSAQAQADGRWSVDCELNKPYNLSTHEINAKVRQINGITVTTASKECYYDINAVEAKSVLMTFYNGWLRHNVDVTFDFEAGTTSSNNYMFYTATDFTFVADLTANDTTSVRGVTFYVYTSQNEVRALKGFFDQKQGRWVAVSHFDSYNLPVNLTVDIEAVKEFVGDRQELDDGLAGYMANLTEEKEVIAQMDAEYDSISSYTPDEEDNICEELSDILLDNNIDTQRIQELVGLLESIAPNSQETDEEPLHDDLDIEEALEHFQKDSIYEALHLRQDISDIDLPVAPYEGSFEFGNISGTVSIEKLTAIDKEHLLTSGYEQIETTDGSEVYCLISEDGITCIDTKAMLRYRQQTNVFDEFLTREGRKSFLSATAKDLPFSDKIDEIKRILRTLDVNAVSEEALRNLANTFKTLISKSTNLYTSCRKWVVDQWNLWIGNTVSLCDGMLAECEYQVEKHRKAVKIAANDLLAHPTDLGKAEVLKKELELLRKYKAKRFEWETAYRTVGKGVEFLRKQINKIPYMPKSAPISDYAKVGSKLLGIFGAFMELTDAIEFFEFAYQECQNWGNLIFLINNKIPCPKNPDQALQLQRSINWDALDYVGVLARNSTSKFGAFAIDAASLVVDLVPVAGLVAWFASGILNVYAEWSNMLTIDKKFLDKFANYVTAIQQLQCDDTPPPPPGGGEDNGGGRNNGRGGNGNGGGSGYTPPFHPLEPIHDPSGFVYEAVPTNRVKDVTATIYHDEEEPKLWDAKNYSQVNPIVTGEAGLYAWDVPQGMWQVRFEKSGYETAQTEWLPVPPPQMEINIPLQQAVAPHVEKARGTESGIWLTFSKYMKPETLTKNGRITVSRNGSNAKGNVVLLNLEEDPYNKKEFASRVKFVPNTAFKTTDEVIVTVKKEVASYADKLMVEDFVQRVVIEPELQAIVCDSLIAVDYMHEAVLEVSVLPAEAAKGQTLMVESTSPIIASTGMESVKLDSEGKARLVVSGNLPGSASLRLSMPEAELERMAEVNVVLAETVVRMPKASKRPGSMVAPDYLLELTSSTKGATIYYTLDGSCPCDEQQRKRYTGPFTLPLGEVTVKAIATREGMEDSDVATFVYNVSELAGIGSSEAVSRQLEAVYADGRIIVSGAEGAKCHIYDLQGRELAYRKELAKQTAIGVARAEAYVITAKWPDGHVASTKVAGK